MYEVYAILKAVIRFLPQRDEYVLWYVDPGGVHSTSLSLRRDGGLEFRRVRDMPRITKAPLIAALHPSYAWSAVVPVPHGGDGASSVYKSEVGHLLEYATRKYRPVAAKALEVNELDAVVVDAYVGEFFPRAARGVRPVPRVYEGSRRKSELAREQILCVTFATRAVFELLAPHFKVNREVFVTDAWRAEAMLLAEVEACPLQYVALDPSGSYRYTIASHGATSRAEGVRGMPLTRERFEWQAEMPITLLSKAWHLDQATGEAVFRKFFREQFSSAHINSFFTKTLAPARQSFFDAVSFARIQGTPRAKGVRGNVWVRGASHLPFVAFPYSRGATRIASLPAQEVLERLGVHTRMPNHDAEALFVRLAPFLEYDRLARPMGELHQFLRRCIHWMFS